MGKKQVLLITTETERVAMEGKDAVAAVCV